MRPTLRRAQLSLSIALCTVFLTSVAATASAQALSRTRFYAGGSLLIDIKRFSGDPADNPLDGDTVGVALTVGTAVGSQWDAQVDVDLPRSTETVRERTVILGRSAFQIQSITTNRIVAVASLLRFRPEPRGRLQLGYLAGMSIVALRQRFETLAPDTVPTSVIPHPAESIDYAAAPTIGADAQIDVDTHIAIVAALLVTPFATRDVGGIVLRPRLGVRWTF